MKLSNFILSIVASTVIGLAVSSSYFVISKQSSAEITVVASDSNRVSMDIPKNLSHHQAELLSQAYEIAQKDGHKQPQILQGIILQETKAGDLKSYKVAGQEFGLKTNARYYGVAQIKLDAAKDVLKTFPDLKIEFGFHTNTDEEVIAKLIENDRFNMSIASKYLLLLRNAGYDTIKQLAVAYNQGAGGARNIDPNKNHYSNGVMAYIQQIKIN
jgi:hypothetical protein